MAASERRCGDFEGTAEPPVRRWPRPLELPGNAGGGLRFYACVIIVATVCDRSRVTHLRRPCGHEHASLGPSRVSAGLERPVQQVGVRNFHSAVIRAFPLRFVPPQPVVVATSELLGIRKPRSLDRPKFVPALPSTVELPATNGELQSRSPGLSRRCAARARAVAVDAAYRFTISRLRQPVSRIRSPSAPPSASHW